jgi:hypothetical protein
MQEQSTHLCEEYLEDVSYKSGTTLNIALVTNNLKLERRWKKVQT